MIRAATTDDMPDLIRMGRAFYETTERAGIVPFCPASAEVTARLLLEQGVLLVAEFERHVIGMIGLLVAPSLMNHAYRVASEIMWWVDADARFSGAGLHLIRAAENAAREAGAIELTMVRLDNSPRAAELVYLRRGYRPAEHSYTKVL